MNKELAILCTIQLPHQCYSRPIITVNAQFRGACDNIICQHSARLQNQNSVVKPTGNDCMHMHGKPQTVDLHMMKL
jgi:hypothetical protein